jgi:small-conductance mechanosensitive channel
MRLEDWTIPLAFFGGGLLLGLIFERLIVRRLAAWASQSEWKTDGILWRSVRGMALLWFTLAGLYFAALTAPAIGKHFAAVQKVLLIILILSVTLVTARAVSGLMTAYSRSHRALIPAATIFVNLARIFIFIFGLLTIFRTLGISVAPALTALGVGGLAVALALQDTLSNLFAGIQILASREISPGEFIRLNTGEEGHVVDITWRYTTLRSSSNNFIIVPNSKISTNLITNFHLPSPHVSMTINVTVAVDSDREKTMSMLRDVAKEVEASIQGSDFQPVVHLASVGVTGLTFSVKLIAKEYSAQSELQDQFAKSILNRASREAIVIRAIQR